MNNDASKKRFLSGVSALTLSTVIVKVIGLVYKIPMMHSLGAEGMGYFNSAYELYTLFFVIATAGLPVAVSILISESLAHGRLRNVKKIYRISFALFFGLGLVGALVMSLCADLGVFFVPLEDGLVVVLNVGILIDNEGSKPVHIPIECIHTESVNEIVELAVCEINHTLTEITPDTFQLIVIGGGRGGGVGYTTLT